MTRFPVRIRARNGDACRYSNAPVYVQLVKKPQPVDEVIYIIREMREKEREACLCVTVGSACC